MTHSGGKPHEVGYRGQRYEVSIFNDNAGGRMVVGWTNDNQRASLMAGAIALHPGWSAALVTDLLSDISHTLHEKWIGERPLPTPVVYLSNAQWPLYVYRDGISTDAHTTREQAGAACAALLTDGFNGEGKHFPLKVWISER